jgi:hypothetical protein
MALAVAQRDHVVGEHAAPARIGKQQFALHAGQGIGVLLYIKGWLRLVHRRHFPWRHEIARAEIKTYPKLRGFFLRI